MTEAYFWVMPKALSNTFRPVKILMKKDGSERIRQNMESFLNKEERIL